MNKETENEKQFNFRLTLEKLENDSRKIVEIVNSYAGSTPNMNNDKLIAETTANTYKHILYLLDKYLGPNWGRKGYNTLD